MGWVRGNSSAKESSILGIYPSIHPLNTAKHQLSGHGTLSEQSWSGSRRKRSKWIGGGSSANTMREVLHVRSGVSGELPALLPGWTLGLFACGIAGTRWQVALSAGFVVWNSPWRLLRAINWSSWSDWHFRNLTLEPAWRMLVKGDSVDEELRDPWNNPSEEKWWRWQCQRE